MSQTTPAPPRLGAGDRRFSCRWPLLAVALVLVVGVSAVLWYRGWGRPTSGPPQVDLAGIDPEVAAAIQEARSLVDQRPGSAPAWGLLARRLHAYKFFPQALECYAEAEKLDPHNADWPYLRAVILLDSPTPAAAIPPLREASERVGGEFPRLRLGEVLLEQGQGEEAAEQFRAVLTQESAEPRAHLGLAQVAAARQQWRDCLGRLEAAAAAPSARKLVCALRARADEGLGDDAGAEAQRRLLAGLLEDPPWPDPIAERSLSFPFGLQARLKTAMQLLREREAQESVALLEDTVRKYPNSDAAWDRLGRVLGALRQFGQAEQALQRSLELAPDAGDVWFYLGLMRLEQRRFDEALVAFRTAARLKPTDAGAHCKIAECLAGEGDREAAAAAYREALRYQPDLAEAREALARLQTERP